MLKNILNLEGVSVLTKKQQGSINGGGGCHVFIRDENGIAIGWSSSELSLAEAQEAYNSDFTDSEGSYISGYCCASCDDRGVH